jgi:hypothetical protein
MRSANDGATGKIRGSNEFSFVSLVDVVPDLRPWGDIRKFRAPAWDDVCFPYLWRTCRIQMRYQNDSVPIVNFCGFDLLFCATHDAMIGQGAARTGRPIAATPVLLATNPHT